MKKVIFIALFAFFATKSFAQAAEKYQPPYNGEFTIYGDLDFTNHPNGTADSSTKEKNFRVRTKGGYGHVAYDIGYRLIERTWDIAFGYALVRASSKETITTLGICPKLQVISDHNYIGGTSLFVGGETFLQLRRMDRFDINLGVSYTSKWKDSSSDFKKSVWELEADFEKKFGYERAFGVALIGKWDLYANMDPAIQPTSTRQVFSESTINLGLRLSYEYKNIVFRSGPSLERTRESYKQVGKQNDWVNNSPQLKFHVSLTYEFQNLFK